MSRRGGTRLNVSKSAPWIHISRSERSSPNGGSGGGGPSLLQWLIIAFVVVMVFAIATEIVAANPALAVLALCALLWWGLNR